MKRSNVLLLALCLALVMVATVAAPVSAKEKPISGKMELTFLGDNCPEGIDPDERFFTWVGTVVIDGVTYGWVDFPTGPFIIEGNFGYFEEYWTIFALGEGPIVPQACDPDLVLIDGYNTGWGPVQGNVGKAEGTVDSAHPEGPFAEVMQGSRMMWRGKVYAPGQFKATFHIFPL